MIRDVEARLRRLGLPVEAADRLSVLLDRLANADAPTSVHDPRIGADVHIADSVVALEVDEIRTAEVLADVGAGAGVPGLVLAAVLPRTRVYLVESARRKCDFVRAAAHAMRLDNAEVVCTRAEEWQDGIGRCDVVCARAVAPLAILCEYAAPLLRQRGVLVAWKGTIDAVESADALAAAEHLGLAAPVARPVVPYEGSERRTLYVLRKVGPTPSRFPRRAGMASKRPLSAKTLR